MEIGELIKQAYAGPNSLVFAMLNVIAFAAHRMAQVSTTWAFGMAGIFGGFMGGLGAFVETGVDTEAAARLATTAMLNAALVGVIVGAGSSLLIGWGVSTALDRAGLWPVSDAKRITEAVRDPLNMTEPSALPEHQPQPPQP